MSTAVAGPWERYAQEQSARAKSEANAPWVNYKGQPELQPQKDYIGPSKEGQQMPITGFEDVEPKREMPLHERLGVAALSFPLMAGASPLAIPAAGAVGGLEGFAEHGEPKEALIGAGLGAGTAALPLGVRMGTRALLPRAAANPGMSRLVGAGVGAAGGGLLGAAGGYEAGHPMAGAVGGPLGGAFMGRHIGADVASAGERMLMNRLGLPSPLEKAARTEAMVAGRNAPGPWQAGRGAAIRAAEENAPLPYEPSQPSPRMKSLMRYTPGGGGGRTLGTTADEAAIARTRERVANTRPFGAVEEQPPAEQFKPSPTLKERMRYTPSAGGEGGRPYAPAPVRTPARSVTGLPEGRATPFESNVGGLDSPEAVEFRRLSAMKNSGKVMTPEQVNRGTQLARKIGGEQFAHNWSLGRTPKGVAGEMGMTYPTRPNQ